MWHCYWGQENPVLWGCPGRWGCRCSSPGLHPEDARGTSPQAVTASNVSRHAQCPPGTTLLWGAEVAESGLGHPCIPGRTLTFNKWLFLCRTKSISVHLLVIKP